MLLVPEAAVKWCARRVSEAVVDGKGLPMRCLRASRPRNTRPKRPHFILHSGAFFIFSV